MTKSTYERENKDKDHEIKKEDQTFEILKMIIDRSLREKSNSQEDLKEDKNKGKNIINNLK